MLLLPYFSHSSLFFSFIAAAFSMIHLLFLHQVWANNPLGVSSQIDKVTFHPYFTFKDIVGFVVMLSILLILTLLAPYFLCDPDNFIPANPLVMPPHIQPQWCSLFACAILRSVPNKLWVIVLAASVAILIILPFTHAFKFQSLPFYHLNQIVSWTFVTIVLLLTWIGARLVENPYVFAGQVLTILHFSFYFIDPLFFIW